MIKHLILCIAVGTLLVSCTAAQTNTPTPTVEGIWENLPIMTRAVVTSEPPAFNGYPYTVYSYTTDADMKAAESFYLDTMKAAGWELLDKRNIDCRGQDCKVGEDLLYSKGDGLVTIQIWIWKGKTTTNIALEPSQEYLGNGR